MSEKNKVKKGGAIGSALIVVRDWLKKSANKKILKVIEIVLVALLLLAGGFLTGRQTIHIEPQKPEIIYLPGEPIEVPADNPKPKPIYVIVPTDTANVIAECIKTGKYYELFPEKVRDSIIYVTKEDSAAVIKDWATERLYNETVFDIDTVGTAVLAAKTQYNRLEILGTTFVPVQKTEIIKTTVAKKYAPFVGIGVSTLPSYSITGGMFFEDKYGVGVTFERMWDQPKNAVALTMMYKF